MGDESLLGGSSRECRELAGINAAAAAWLETQALDMKVTGVALTVVLALALLAVPLAAEAQPAGKVARQTGRQTGRCF